MGSAIKSEIRKAFSTRLWWGLLIADALLGGLLSFGWAFQLGTENSEPSLRVPSAVAAQSIYSAGFIVTVAQLFPLALGVILITSEFRHKTWTSTVLAQPKRWPIPLAKIVSLVVVGAVYGIVYNIAAVIGGAITMKGFRNSSLYLTSGAVWQTLALMLLAFVVWTLLGFGFGLLIRNQIAAVFIAIGLAFIGNLLFTVLFNLLHWEGAIKFLPSNLTASMLNPSFDGQGEHLTWWASALVLTAYGLGLAALGSVLNQRKDVL